MREKVRLGLLCSGQGTNGANIISYVREHARFLEVAAAVTDNPSAPAISRWAALGVEMKVIAYNKIEGKEVFEKKILDYLDEMKVEWVCLVGYMRILSEPFLRHFWSDKLAKSKVVNIHPSLLPAFPGKDAYERAFAGGVAFSGATLHFVDGGVDTGPIIYQESFERRSGDSLEEFKLRGFEVEYRLYRKFLAQLEEGSL